MVLAFPFFIVVLAGGLIGTGGTIVLYGLFLAVDFAAAIALFVIAARYASQARRGALFSIPYVSRLSDRWKAGERDDEEPTRRR